ncbi:CPBP family intramembrane metalloprotease, partial [Candidatus Falkowbacteria bacterium]|nr:CPBP family intramembrane metalloprotease [Candidatus Falkowbacteria bacterium]
MDYASFFKSNKKGVLYFAALACLAAFSFIFFELNKSKAYPEIGMEMKIDRKGSEKKANDFLSAQRVDSGKYKKVTEFISSSQAMHYLDKTLGPKEAGTLLNNDIDTWGFETRFFIPSDQEEYSIAFDNLGRFSSFSRIIPDEKEGAKLSEAEAQAIAEGFVRKNYYDDLSQYDLIEKDSNDRGKRIDYTFSWEAKNINIQDAKKRLLIEIDGDQVASFSTYLKIPEAWTRQESANYAKNKAAQAVAEVSLFLVLYLPLFVVFIRRFKNRQFDYKFALKVACVTGGVTLLLIINSIPTIYSGYDTLDTWSNFIATQVFFGLLAPVMAGLGTWLLILVCESYFREANPDKPSLENIFSKAFFSDSRYLQALFVGFLSGFVIAAYQVAYYLIVRKFNFWVPSDVLTIDAFSGLAPWAYIFAAGLLPAISEEITFRLFGITFLSKILKKTWLAALVSSLIWAFLHSSYPQQPFFARGLELLPVGLFFSFLYLRYGILTSITAHFTLNSLLTLQYLIKGNAIDKVLSVAMFCVPIMLMVLIGVLRRRQTAVTVSNSEISEKLANRKVAKEKKIIRLMEYKILSHKFNIGLAVMLVLGVVAYAIVQFSPDDPFLPSLGKSKSRNEIMALSDNYLKERGIEPGQYMRTTSYYANFSEDDQSYLLDLPGGKDKLKMIFEKQIPAYLWEVRYFKPMEKEGYLITMLINGDLYSFDHPIPEVQKGASLSKSDAQQLAETYLKSRKDLDFSKYSLVEVVENKKNERMDYSVVFKEGSFDLGDGSLRASVYIRGDEVGNFSKYVYIPESWYRDNSKSGIRNFIVGVVGFILMLCFLVYTVVSYLRLNRDGLIVWRKGLLYSLPGVAVSLVTSLNGLSSYYSGYDGVESLKIFHMKSILSHFLGYVVLILFLAMLFAFLLALVKENVIDPIIPEERGEKKRVLRDAVKMG